MFTISLHNPFPSGMSGDLLNGAVCEFSIDDGASSRFIMIRPQKYNYEHARFLLDNNILEVVITPLINLLEHVPTADVLWLYHLTVFDVAREFREDQILLFDNRQNFQEFVFDDINEVLSFCKKQFSISISDFKKSWETNYPQW